MRLRFLPTGLIDRDGWPFLFIALCHQSNLSRMERADRTWLRTCSDAPYLPARRGLFLFVLASACPFGPWLI